MTRPLDPSRPEYWADVRKRAKQRKALKIAAATMERTRSNLVYESWVRDNLDAFQNAARAAGITEIDHYNEAKAAWAKQTQLSELMDLTDDEIHEYASDALEDARQALYG